MAIMGAAVEVLLAVVLLAQYRLDRGYPGVGWWAGGQASIAAGILVSALRGDSPAGRIAVPAYQAILLLGVMLVFVGLQRFLDERGRWRWLAGVWCVFVAWSAFHTFVVDSATLRAMALYLTLSLVLAAMAVFVWRHRLTSVRGSATYLGTVFAIASLSYLVLATAEPFRTVVGNPFYAPSPVNAGAFLAAVASTLLWTFGLVIMVNQRLAADVQREARNMRSVFTTGPDCSIISRLADGVIDDVNEGFTSLTGFSQDEVIGRSTQELGLWADPAARTSLVDAIRSSGSVKDLPMTLRRKDGSTVECVVAASTLVLDDEPHVVTVTRDVTEQRRFEDQLMREATTDSLTGLPNRRHFLALCERELRRSERSGSPVAVAVIDVDRFKDINDTHGHAAGDEAVVAFAASIASRIRDVDTLGRLGGDEFGLLLPDADADRARVAVDRVRADVAAQSVSVDGHVLHMTLSAGVASATVDDTVDTWLVRADRALYDAKEEGRNRVMTARAS